MPVFLGSSHAMAGVISRVCSCTSWRASMKSRVAPTLRTRQVKVQSIQLADQVFNQSDEEVKLHERRKKTLALPPQNPPSRHLPYPLELRYNRATEKKTLLINKPLPPLRPPRSVVCTLLAHRTPPRAFHSLFSTTSGCRTLSASAVNPCPATQDDVLLVENVPENKPLASAAWLGACPRATIRGALFAWEMLSGRAEMV